MVKKNFLMTAPLLMASFCSAQEKPNVVLIMVDDMGYSDIGCYGGEILTPNIDALASKGVRFTQFYNTSRSCPARASLMTGQVTSQPFNNLFLYATRHIITPFAIRHIFGITASQIFLYLQRILQVLDAN